MRTSIRGPETPVLSAPSARVTNVVITANRVVPQPPGTTIIWKATPSGGAGPYEYEWLLFNGSEWDVVKNWSPSDTLRWTPTFDNPRYRVLVRVRIAGAAAHDFEAMTEAAFAIALDSSALSLQRVQSARRPADGAHEPVSTVTLTADLPSPQPAGTAVTWTAAATGGGPGRQYQWFVYDGGRWTIAQPWSTAETFSWIPETPNNRYRIAVWARSSASTIDDFDACAEVGFAIGDGA